MQNRSLRRLPRGLHTLAAVLCLTVAAFASEPATKKFDVPADQAPAAIKVFSQQAGVEVLFSTDAVASVRTHAAKGDMTPKAALETMVAGTGFVVVQDEKTGALGLRQGAAAKNGQSRPAASQTAEAGQGRIENGMLRLEDVHVFGSRIRQTEREGPSPVSAYNQDYIRATGAMTLSDFLNQIPQTYSGIAFGRGSAPNELNPDFGQRSESSSPPFNFVLGIADAPLAQTGSSGVSLRGLGSGSTLVLVDGRRVTQSGSGNQGTDTRQGFVDLNTIPLGMIDRVEVITDGASAIYGADAVAGVINIVLKQNYTGSELSGSYKASEHGGGRERNASLTTGFSSGKLSGVVTIDYYDRQNLKASDRAYSKNQDHTAIPAGTLISTGAVKFGRDYRFNWGYPAVVQASGGIVSGTFDAIPGVRVVLVPTGAASTPTVAQFIPVTTPAAGSSVVNASGQRRANTANYLDLIPKSERWGASGRLTYKMSDRVQAYASYRTSDSRTRAESQPVTSITGGFGSAVSLPAAFNPFNQNVTIGMVLPEWGSTAQTVRTTDDTAYAGLRGQIGQTWQWDLTAGWEHQNVVRTNRAYNGAGLSGLLTNADATKRFNPFIDAGAAGAPSQVALLETLAVYPSVDSTSDQTSLEFNADGNVVDIWGGPVKLATGGSMFRNKVDITNLAYSAAATPVATTTYLNGAQNSNAIYAEASIPIVGKPNAKDWLRRLDLQVAGRYSQIGPFSKAVPKYGISITPVKSLLLRASWSEGFRAPGVTEYLVPNSTVASTLSDPLRNPPTTTGVVVYRGSNPDPKPELSDTTFAGLVYEPAFIKGLSLQVNYYDTIQKDVLQLLTAQTLINNEALFPDRITRAAPTPSDQALNQPGQITAVNQVFVNFGKVVNRNLEFIADYTLPWAQLGRWRVNAAASRLLESSRRLSPGQPSVVLDDDTAAPPKWKINASLFWNKGAWNASAFLWYLDGFASNQSGNTLVANDSATIYFATPAVTKLDLRAGYEFKRGVWRGYGKGLRVNFGVNNVFDKEPPFSDTVWGFNAGLHSQLILGRAYEFSFVLPL